MRGYRYTIVRPADGTAGYAISAAATGSSVAAASGGGGSSGGGKEAGSDLAAPGAAAAAAAKTNLDVVADAAATAAAASAAVDGDGGGGGGTSVSDCKNGGGTLVPSASKSSAKAGAAAPGVFASATLSSLIAELDGNLADSLVSTAAAANGANAASQPTAVRYLGTAAAAAAAPPKEGAERKEREPETWGLDTDAVALLVDTPDGGSGGVGGRGGRLRTHRERQRLARAALRAGDVDRLLLCLGRLEGEAPPVKGGRADRYDDPAAVAERAQRRAAGSKGEDDSSEVRRTNGHSSGGRSFAWLAPLGGRGGFLRRCMVRRRVQVRPPFVDRVWFGLSFLVGASCFAAAGRAFSVRYVERGSRVTWFLIVVCTAALYVYRCTCMCLVESCVRSLIAVVVALCSHRASADHRCRCCCCVTFQFVFTEKFSRCCRHGVVERPESYRSVCVCTTRAGGFN